MFYQLPPAGNPVKLHADVPAGSFLQDFFSPYTARYFASGTAALAAAIITAIRLKGATDPEVILPAYGCPDLVSAALFAGARPVLVDLEPERPWINLDQLAARINESTVAVVAVNLFGIRERLAQLQRLASDASVLLIEDSAQAFPASASAPSWAADLVVISFGRGKPVSLLGGGGLLFKDASLERLLDSGLSVPDPGRGRASFRFRIKAALYNLLLSPRLYWMPQALPFLHLGETRFHPLAEIAAMDQLRVGLLAANIRQYQARGGLTRARISKMTSESLLDDADIIDLPRVCGASGQLDLLRYPLLLAVDKRDRVYACLKHRGLGPSKMYPSTLPHIPGLERCLAGAGEFPAAEEFSRRILTLPVHGEVRVTDIDKMAKCLLRSCRYERCQSG